MSILKIDHLSWISLYLTREKYCHPLFLLILDFLDLLNFWVFTIMLEWVTNDPLVFLLVEIFLPTFDPTLAFWRHYGRKTNGPYQFFTSSLHSCKQETIIGNMTPHLSYEGYHLYTFPVYIHRLRHLEGGDLT